MPKPKGTAISGSAESKKILAFLNKMAKSRAQESEQILNELRKSTRSQNDALEQVLTALQNIFIVEGRRSGMEVDDIRKTLKIAKNGVTDITQHMKQSSPSKDHE